MKQNDDLISLNDELFNDFFVNELEKRLETDPLVGGGLAELFSPIPDIQGGACFSCTLCSPICSPIIE